MYWYDRYEGINSVYQVTSNNATVIKYSAYVPFINNERNINKIVQ